MTSLLVRDPFLAAPFRLMDEILRTGRNGTGVTGFTPPLDVQETAEEYLVLVDLPGVKVEDVTIELNDHVLTLSGVRTADVSGDARVAERSYGAFARSLTLPKGVDGDRISAEHSDGVLSVRIPKPAEQKPKKIAIGTSPQKVIEQ
jgi:HSP20 family protein